MFWGGGGAHDAVSRERVEMWQRPRQDKPGLHLGAGLLVLAEPANEEDREERDSALCLTDGQWVGNGKGYALWRLRWSSDLPLLSPECHLDTQMETPRN